jgi:hypothetical protein
VKSQLPRIAVLTALALLVVAAEKFSFGVVWDTIFLSIFVAGLISVWVAGLRMRRKIRSVLGRKATEADLASIKTWITVQEREEVAGHAQTPKVPILPYNHLNADVAISTASGSSEPVSLVSHSYADVGKRVVPAEFGAGKTPYVLMVLGPILLMWRAGPATVSHALWFHLAVTIYVLFFIAAVACLRTLKLEIRTDGISYASLFCKGNTIAFPEISSAVVLTDRHTQEWPEFNWRDFIITPKPETGKPPIKIALLLFPAEARDHLMRVLMPEQRSCGMGSVTLFGKR